MQKLHIILLNGDTFPMNRQMLNIYILELVNFHMMIMKNPTCKFIAEKSFCCLLYPLDSRPLETDTSILALFYSPLLYNLRALFIPRVLASY